MTLDTRVYVLDEINYKDVWIKCNQLIGATENTKFTDEQTKTYRAGKGVVEPGNPWWIWNTPGQGLCALLDMHYRPFAPYRSAEQAAAHDEDICNLPGVSWYDSDEGPCDGTWHRPACWLEISFDTAYGYRDEQGRGCGDLHASIVAELGKWLDERGIRWLWKNEYSGEIHSGYEALNELCSSGAQASAWYHSTVLPAIASRIARGEDL